MKPVTAPVCHVTGSSPSVCPVLMATTWRVVCVDSTVHCRHTLQTMVPADAVLPTVTSAPTRRPVSVSHRPSGQLFNSEWIPFLNEL